MELNNYRSVTPLRKKRKKITASAAVVLCLISLIVGIICGRAAVSNKQAQEAQEKIDKIEFDMTAENEALQKTIETQKEKINSLKQQLAQAQVPAENDEAPLADGEEATEDENEDKDEPKSSGGFFRTLLIILVIIVIIGCVVYAASIFLKKNEE
ncbi:MAG: hypothetical protein IJZ81_04045, partial [Clostridia bacterium]|nr:hypothetical protein [Clostridia bacterium]